VQRRKRLRCSISAGCRTTWHECL